MDPRSISLIGVSLLAAVACRHAAGQVSPVRSSLEAESRISLSVVGLVEELEDSDDQGGTTATLGPIAAPVSISSADGFFTASSNGNAAFTSAEAGVFTSMLSYDGDEFGDEPVAQSFGHTLGSAFEYDFMIDGEGSVTFQGDLSNSGPSSIGFFARLQVFSEFMPGSGFVGSGFFDQTLTDGAGGVATPFSITVPLTAASGSYRVRVGLNHSGISILDTDPEMGSTTINWSIAATEPCPADANGDGMLTPADFTAWILAFNTSAPACDQNGDGLCTPADFSSWVLNFNTGC
ncbi:MAG: GC-type dockerin domain-anchored protein [Planctomycetota bacterium]